MSDYHIQTSDVFERGIDTLFASVKFYQTTWASGVCYDAILKTTQRFDPDFPGWFFYRRVRHGDARFDRALEAFAIGGARALARSTKENGRAYIGAATRGKAGWVAQAGRDALDYAIFGKYSEGLNERAARFDVHWKTYQSIRDPLAAGLFIGVETWTSELHCQFSSLARRSKSRDH